MPTTEKRLDIEFKGIDFWSRPVFFCEWNKCYYGSTDKLFSEGATEDDVLKELDDIDICFFGDSFGCEPMGSNPKYPVQFVKNVSVEEIIKNNVKELIDKIKSLDWTIESLGEDDGRFQIGKYSPCGQDFSFIIEPGKTVAEFIGNIYIAYGEYDVSNETYIWLDDMGHGKIGAPFDMKAVYEDMEACRDMILQLYEALEVK